MSPWGRPRFFPGGSLPGLARSRACPTSALNCRNRKHPISRQSSTPGRRLLDRPVKPGDDTVAGMGPTRDLLPRRRADQLRQLCLAEWLAEKLEFHRIAQNSRHVGHLVGLQGFLRREGLYRIADAAGGFVDLLVIRD